MGQWGPPFARETAAEEVGVQPEVPLEREGSGDNHVTITRYNKFISCD